VTTRHRPQTIQELARLLGRYRYVELTLFVITGRAVSRSEAAAVAVQLSTMSHAHAYRAELIERRLLVSDGLDRAPDSTKTPSAEHEILFESLEGLTAEELIAMLGLAWYPAMLVAYRERLAICDQASEGPVRLMLSRVIFDLESTITSLSQVCDSSRFVSETAATRSRIADVRGPFGTLSL